MAESLTRVQRRQRATRERIFRAALELFARKGFEQTTVVEISAAADIGKGTFFTYFPTKESVFAYLGDLLVEAMAAAVAQAPGAPTGDTLGRLFAAAAGWHEANRPLTRQVVLAGMGSGAVLEADAPNAQRMLALLVAVVGAGQARGEITPAISAEDAALVLSGAYFATVLAWSLSEEPRPLAARLDAALNVVLQGILTHAQPTV